MKTLVSVVGMILALLILLTVFPGCTETGSHDPDTGVRTWITAVNARDYVQLYDLAPREIRNAVSRDDFIKEQESNPFLAPGNSVEQYCITDRSGSGNTVSFTARLILATRVTGNASSVVKIPLYIKFIEHYEDGEWKVWTAAP